MAHFALLDTDNTVKDIIVIDNNDTLDANGKESELVGVAKCYELTNLNSWKQCSYNDNFRGHYPILGDIYDGVNNIYKSSSSPFPSWVLDMTTGYYNAPVAYPDDGLLYSWDEETIQWKQR